jgi:hypothetical protein
VLEDCHVPVGQVEGRGQELNSLAMRSSALAAFQSDDGARTHPGAFSKLFLRETGGEPVMAQQCSKRERWKGRHGRVPYSSPQRYGADHGRS